MASIGSAGKDRPGKGKIAGRGVIKRELASGGRVRTSIIVTPIRKKRKTKKKGK